MHYIIDEPGAPPTTNRERERELGHIHKRTSQ